MIYLFEHKEDIFVVSEEQQTITKASIRYDYSYASRCYLTIPKHLTKEAGVGYIGLNSILDWLAKTKGAMTPINKIYKKTQAKNEYRRPVENNFADVAKYLIKKVKNEKTY